MMANYNEKTGIPYGVLAAQGVPELWDDITTNGDDLTFEAHREEVTVCDHCGHHVDGSDNL